MSDYVERPGDLNPKEPSLAYEFMASGDYQSAARFFKIWIDHYKDSYRSNDEFRGVLGNAYCDMGASA